MAQTVARWEKINARIYGTTVRRKRVGGFRSTEAVRVIREKDGWRIDRAEIIHGSWMPWEAINSTTYRNVTEAKKAVAAWARKPASLSGGRRALGSAKRGTRLAQLRDYAADQGLTVSTWSPGDGVTRYRFHTKPNADYFGDDGVCTALGLKAAWRFARSGRCPRSRRRR